MCGQGDHPPYPGAVVTAAPIFRPRPEPWLRTRCANCGTLQKLHVYDDKCPTSYRPGTLVEAQRELDRAVASGDQGRIFVARGDVQRLTGRPARLHADTLLRPAAYEDMDLDADSDADLPDDRVEGW